MNVVIIEMRKNGKLVRTFRETFIGGMVGGRDAMKHIAMANITNRVGRLFPGNTFNVRNSNM